MLGDKKGDQQARAELLATLLAANGEKAYWLKVNHHKATYCLVLLRVRDVAWLNQLPGGAPKTVKVGSEEFVALALEPGANIGEVPPQLYDAATRRWSSTVVLTRWI